MALPVLATLRVRRILLSPFPGLRAVQGRATSVLLLLQLDDHAADTANRAMTRAQSGCGRRHRCPAQPRLGQLPDDYLTEALASAAAVPSSARPWELADRHAGYA